MGCGSWCRRRAAAGVGTAQSLVPDHRTRRTVARGTQPPFIPGSSRSSPPRRSTNSATVSPLAVTMYGRNTCRNSVRPVSTAMIWPFTQSLSIEFHRHHPLLNRARFPLLLAAPPAVVPRVLTQVQVGPAARGRTELHPMPAPLERQQQPLLGELIHEAHRLAPEPLQELADFSPRPLATGRGLVWYAHYGIFLRGGMVPCLRMLSVEYSRVLEISGRGGCLGAGGSCRSGGRWRCSHG